MGCLNSHGQFAHWFGNIHLSGPCNRSCYFCIGQHMMVLDRLNTLDSWPLPGIEAFVDECLTRGVTEVNLTGSNTDPMLYKHLPALNDYLRNRIPGLVLGLRTNAVKANYPWWHLFDKGSVTICSFDPDIYRAMMGKGSLPDIEEIIAYTRSWSALKVNIVLGPENINDLMNTLEKLRIAGVDKVNVREPYGQPHIGNPISLEQAGEFLGMPYYWMGPMRVTYWDVHYVHVESVNLYASGRVSVTYPITKGHAPTGEVHDQSHFPGGRIQEQWLGLKGK